MKMDDERVKYMVDGILCVYIGSVQRHKQNTHIHFLVQYPKIHSLEEYMDAINSNNQKKIDKRLIDGVQRIHLLQDEFKNTERVKKIYGNIKTGVRVSKWGSGE